MMTTTAAEQLLRASSRAEILGEAIRYSAEHPGLVLATDMLAHLLRQSGKAEEELGSDLYEALNCLVRQGVFLTNRPDGMTGGVIIAADTRVCAGALLAGYLFDFEPPAANDATGEVDR